MLDDSTYEKDIENYKKKISKYGLKFSLEDISYIIVKNENDIPQLVDKISRIFNSEAEQKSLKILLTKIITSEQIISDF